MSVVPKFEVCVTHVDAGPLYSATTFGDMPVPGAVARVPALPPATQRLLPKATERMFVLPKFYTRGVQVIASVDVRSWPV